MRIETKDLYLAKAKMEDLDSIYNNFWKHEETAKYMNWTPCKNIEEAKERLIGAIEFQKNRIGYFVYEKSTKQAIGMVGIKEIAPKVYEDGGIGIGPNFTGKGYGKQILNALLFYTFNILNADKFIASCHTENIPSAKMQLACGLKYTHSEMVTRKKDNLTYKSDYYAITKEEYQSKN